MPNASFSPKHAVLFLAPYTDKRFETLYPSFFRQLKSEFDFKGVYEDKDGKKARELLSSTKFHAVIAGDNAFGEEAFEDIRRQVLIQVNDGAILILSFGFTTMTALDDMDAFFEKELNLSWRTKIYNRCQVSFNPDSILPLTAGSKITSFPRRVSIKALLLTVKDAAEAILVESASGYEDDTSVALAGKPRGDGYIAYIGDANVDEPTEAAIFGLLGQD